MPAARAVAEPTEPPSAPPPAATPPPVGAAPDVVALLRPLVLPDQPPTLFAVARSAHYLRWAAATWAAHGGRPADLDQPFPATVDEGVARSAVPSVLVHCVLLLAGVDGSGVASCGVTLCLSSLCPISKYNSLSKNFNGKLEKLYYSIITSLFFDTQGVACLLLVLCGFAPSMVGPARFICSVVYENRRILSVQKVVFSVLMFQSIRLLI